MKPNRDNFFDAQRIKEILTAIKEPEIHFEVIIKNEYHNKYLGVYNRRTNEIIIYLLTIDNNQELIRVAIHEYAHCLLYGWGSHNTKFWECYFELMEIAERKGFYSYNIDSCENLKKITAIINEHNLIKNRKIFKKEWYGIFHIILKLCEEINVDFQYYTVKYLGMEWYKKKNPSLSYKLFYRNNEINSHRFFWEITVDDFLKKFFNNFPCSSIL
jgi:hypothetical protein